MRSLFLAVCLAAFFAGGARAQFATNAPAQSATIEPVQGDLSVNQGQGFQRVDTRVPVNVGDSVMVGPGGSANLVYPDGCQVTVQPGSVVGVAPLSPCASGSLALFDGDHNTDALIGGLLFLGGVGGGVYSVLSAKSKPPPPPPPPPVSP